MSSFEAFIGVDFYTALFVLLNTLAIFFVAKKLLFKPVRKLIDERKSEIEGMYSNADKINAEAEQTKKELEARLQSAQSESDRIVKEAVNRAEDKERQILDDARRQAAAIVDRADKEAENLKKQALIEAKDEIASIAVAVAEKVIERQLAPEDDSRLVDEFIDKLGDAK